MQSTDFGKADKRIHPAHTRVVRDHTTDGDIEKNPGPVDAQATENDIPSHHREMVTWLASEIETASNPHYPVKLYKYATQALTEALKSKRRASTPPLEHNTPAPRAESSSTHGTLEVPSPEVTPIHTRIKSCSNCEVQHTYVLPFICETMCARVCVCGLHRFRHAPNNQPERMQNALFDDAWLICFRQYQRSTNCGRSRFATKHSKAPAWDQPLSATVIQLFSLGNGPHFARAFHRGAGPSTGTPSVGICRAHMLGGHARV